MQKLFYIILFSLILVPTFALAAPNINAYTEKIATGAGYDKATDTTLSETIGGYIRVVLSLVGTIFLVLTIYAGFLWMTASGNEEQVTKATDIIKMATIGLVIALAAYSITVFVVSRVGGTTQSATTGGTTTSTAPATEQGFWSAWWGGFVKQKDDHPLGE
ncbi:MAG: hypothetical protein WCV83_03375 [Candidatus Magasanikbacteria bacterium]|jgi:hypothetical protein